MPTASLSKINKSSSYERRLVESLLPYATVRECSKGSVLPLFDEGNSFVFLIIEGIISFHSEKDDLMLTTLSGPALIGIANFVSEEERAYIKMLTPGKIGILSQSQVDEIIEKDNLWELVARFLQDIIKKLFITTNVLTAPTAYELIRIQLLLLMEEPVEYRMTIPVELYIRNKTHLSRSGIMKILSQLRQGEYIKVENGKLIGVNKLPDRY